MPLNMCIHIYTAVCSRINSCTCAPFQCFTLRCKLSTWNAEPMDMWPLCQKAHLLIDQKSTFIQTHTHKKTICFMFALNTYHDHHKWDLLETFIRIKLTYSRARYSTNRILWMRNWPIFFWFITELNCSFGKIADATYMYKENAITFIQWWRKSKTTSHCWCYYCEVAIVYF